MINVLGRKYLEVSSQQDSFYL